MGLGNIWRNLRSRGLKDVTNLDTVLTFFDWEKIKSDGLLIPATEIISFSEQIVYRTRKCKPCVDKGECLHCHCEIIGKISVPKSKCSNFQWEEIMPKDEWEIYKQENRINIILL